jgi:hypothetical protein
MSDPDKRDQRSGLPEGGLSLGGRGEGDFDTSLNTPEEPAAPPPDDAGEEQLALPRNALVAFRKSGGLRFSSRGIVVLRNGWVEPEQGTEGRRRHMSDDAMAILERLILSSGLTRISHRKHKATPDGYAYEIAARIGGKLRNVELQDPIPAEQEKLLRVLSRLLPG